jgi:hypothetical protein
MVNNNKGATELETFTEFYSGILENAESGEEGALSSSWGAVKYVIESLFGGMLNGRMAQASSESVELNVYKYFDIRHLIKRVICEDAEERPGDEVEDKDHDEDDGDLTKEPFPSEEFATSRPHAPILQPVNISRLSRDPSVVTAIATHFPRIKPSEASAREIASTFIEEMSAMEMRKFPTMRRVVHGGMSCDTVLVDMFHVAWLHDFSCAGKGHVFDDLAKFEAELMFHCTPLHNEEELQTGISMLEKLIPCTRMDGVEAAVDLEEQPVKFIFLWQTVLMLRAKAVAFCGDGYDPLHYQIALLSACLKTLGAEKQPADADGLDATARDANYKFGGDKPRDKAVDRGQKWALVAVLLYTQSIERQKDLKKGVQKAGNEVEGGEANDEESIDDMSVESFQSFGMGWLESTYAKYATVEDIATGRHVRVLIVCSESA